MSSLVGESSMRLGPVSLQEHRAGGLLPNPKGASSAKDFNSFLTKLIGVPLAFLSKIDHEDSYLGRDRVASIGQPKLAQCRFECGGQTDDVVWSEGMVVFEHPNGSTPGCAR